MPTLPPRTKRTRGPRAQRGQLALLTIVLLIMATTIGLFSFIEPANKQSDIDAKTDAALAQAREALISYAVTHSDQPGRLPCPDNSNFGQAGTTCSNGATTANRLTRLGRLPWKTLLVPDLRDGYGERLWYAVSANFLEAAGAKINSDTAGEYTVTGRQETSNVVAIIFSAGPPVGNQNRDATVTACPASGLSMARNLCVVNYLEAGNIDGNATFSAGAATQTFNDRVIVITQEALMRQVLARVTSEAQQVLNWFFSGTTGLPANNHFPYANAPSDSSGECTDGELQGRVPVQGTITSLGAPEPPCKIASNWPSYPPWFYNNSWENYLFYAVSSACTQAATEAICLASGGLTVTGLSTNAKALIIATGRAQTGQPQPCATVIDCLEDPENINGDTVFVRPAPSSSNNDHLRIVSP
jgi:hypothetical protein